MRVTRTLAVASAAAIAFAALVTTSPAMADGTSPVADTDIVAAGSDTIQYVADAFQSSYDSQSPAPANPFFSFDAVGSSPIQTKVDTGTSPCAGITRPNGSGAGIKQLALWLGTNNKVPNKTYGYACLDMARASRNLTTSDPNWLTSVIFARDLITWSDNSGGNQVTNLSDQELKAIYLCDATQLPSGDTTHTGAVKWSDLKNEGGTNADAIVPVLPQSNSGTRQQWLTDIFGTSTPSLGSCVINGTYNGTAIEENEGTNSVFTAAGWSGTTTPNAYKDIVFPFSGGDYICEKYTSNCGTINTVEGNLVLANIDGKAPLTTANPPVLNIGLTGFPSLYVRGLYFVVRNGGSQSSPQVATPTTTGSQWPVDMTPFLGQGNSSGWICGTAAATIIKNYGFATAPNCGALLNSTATPSPAPPTP